MFNNEAYCIIIHRKAIPKENIKKKIKNKSLELIEPVYVKKNDAIYCIIFFTQTGTICSRNLYQIFFHSDLKIDMHNSDFCTINIY